VRPTEDREAAFVQFTSASGVEDRPLIAAARAAAGLALATSAAERPLPAELVAQFESGQAMYSEYCGTCHGSDGRGLPATALPLVRSQWVLQDTGPLVRLVLDGMSGPVPVDGTMYDVPEISGVMPGIRATAVTDE
jgi:mono/diheme cytochrome c family protein